MSRQDFERLCAIRETLLTLGMPSLLAALEDGDEGQAEEALTAMIREPVARRRVAVADGPDEWEEDE